MPAGKPGLGPGLLSASAADLRQAAIDLATRIGQGAPLALRAMKEVMPHIETMPTAAALALTKPGRVACPCTNAWPIPRISSRARGLRRETAAGRKDQHQLQQLDASGRRDTPVVGRLSNTSGCVRRDKPLCMPGSNRE
ncbi:hypothetical protein [Thauera sp. SDU_THAU2]|uniref:hypothetical protein n=1 Tax=Thauera sp. SDU_THAU2 TaxID=3136633 RepID=UPI00311E595A